MKFFTKYNIFFKAYTLLKNYPKNDRISYCALKKVSSFLEANQYMALINFILFLLLI